MKMFPADFIDVRRKETKKSENIYEICGRKLEK